LPLPVTVSREVGHGPPVDHALVGQQVADGPARARGHLGLQAGGVRGGREPLGRTSQGGGVVLEGLQSGVHGHGEDSPMSAERIDRSGALALHRPHPVESAEPALVAPGGAMARSFLSALTGSFAFPAAENPTVVMMEAAYRHHRIDARYLNCEVTSGALGDAVLGARAMGWVGFNCSPPHKRAVVQHLDGLAESAQLIGAVNCVVREGTRLIGHNFDGQGSSSRCVRWLILWERRSWSSALA